MVTEEELTNLNLRDGKWGKAEEKLEKVASAVEEYNRTPEIKIDDLAATYGIPRRSLYYYFKKLNLIRGTEKVSEAEKVVRKTEVAALSSEAEKIATIAIGIGGVVARRYLPLINHLLANGRTLDMIATDVMQWFEMKIPTETRIAELEANNERLEDLNSKLAILAKPNIKYILREKVVEDFTRDLVRARMRGARVKIGPAVRALNQKLIGIGKME